MVVHLGNVFCNAVIMQLIDKLYKLGNYVAKNVGVKLFLKDLFMLINNKYSRYTYVIRRVDDIFRIYSIYTALLIPSFYLIF